MAVCLIGTQFSQLVSPIAVNRLLVYLETPNPDVYIRPWFWVFALSTSYVVIALFFQWYTFVATSVLVRVQAILTELVFEHGLRIRLKAEPSGEVSSTDTETPAAEPSASNASTVDRPRNASVTTTAKAHDGELRGKAKAEPAKSKTPLQQLKKKVNMIGKIHTLVTVDVERIAEAKEFLIVLLLVPVELITSMIFLYFVLGWR
jgi:hypothetical protein